MMINRGKLELNPMERGPPWKRGFSSTISCNFQFKISFGLLILGYFVFLFGDYCTLLGWMIKALDVYRKPWL